MKKATVFILVFALLLCLSSCGNVQKDDDDNTTVPDNTIQEPTIMDETEPPVSVTEPQKESLSCDVLLARVKAWAKEQGWSSSDVISDMESEPGEAPNETKTTFSFYKGLASASVSEKNEIVQTVMTVSLPSKFAEIYPSNTSVENSQYAYVVCMELLKFCESDKDLAWHQTKLKSAPDEGDDTMIIRSYTSNDWLYSAMIGEYVVTCIAARYCSQCKANAPEAVFSSAAGICDSCKYPSQGNNTQSEEDPPADSKQDTPKENSSISKVPYTTKLFASAEIYQKPSISSSFVQYVGETGIYTIVAEEYDDIGNLWGKLKSGVGWVLLDIVNISHEQPVVCLHSYAKATCTSPESCIMCGQTRGSALGHSYQAATCTAPETCTFCGQTRGSALGHSYQAANCTEPQICSTCGVKSGVAGGHHWTNITQTIYREEQGHYKEEQDAKKVLKYRCWLCSYAQPTHMTLSEYYAHFDSAHGSRSDSGYFRERYETFEDWVYETVTVWVVDQEAYTETVVTGRYCTVCHKEE